MVETFVNFRPKELWPKRVLNIDDALRQTEDVWKSLEKEGFLQATPSFEEEDSTMIRSFRASAFACLHVVLILSVCLVLPTSVGARVITEDATADGFPQDPAFAAGSLVVPLDNLALSPRDQSFSITVGGTEFHFETLSSKGLVGQDFQTGRLFLEAFNSGIVVTITPPVSVVGLTLAFAECSGRATFVGLRTEVGETNYAAQHIFLGAAEIGDRILRTCAPPPCTARRGRASASRGADRALAWPASRRA